MILHAALVLGLMGTQVAMAPREWRIVLVGYGVGAAFLAAIVLVFGGPADRYWP